MEESKIMPTTLSRQNYLNRNICPRCKCRNLEIGYSSCNICLEATNKWMKENRVVKNIYNKIRYDTLKQMGLCVTCKTETHGNVYCETCTTDKCRTRAFKRPLHSRNRWSKR